MPRSESVRDRIAGADWRAWLALAWVVWFGLLYGKTVADARGGKVRAAVSALLSGTAAGESPSSLTGGPHSAPGSASRP